MRLETAQSGVIAIAGSVGFLTIVIALHFLQPFYDPVQQHMSELALGPHGSLMLMAFSSFAISVYSIQRGLRILRAPQILRMILASAAICLFGSGMVKLNSVPVLHVVLIALAFLLLVIAMYLLPQTTPLFNSWSSRSMSWGLAAGTAFSVSLSGIIPEGISQRAAAACMLVWLCWVGWRILGAGKTHSVEPQR